MNIVILSGNAVKDASVKATAKPMTTFTLAVQRRFKREGAPTADFIDCVVFGKTAEFAEKYVKKGSKITVHGTLQTSTYKDKNDQTVKGFSILCDQIEFAANKKDTSDNTTDPAKEGPAAHTGDDFMSIPDNLKDEELPFIG